MDDFEVPPSFYEQDDFLCLKQAAETNHYQLFIAVGCLVTGQELQTTSDNTLLSILHDLCKQVWITTETIVQSDDLQITRIYVLPYDCQRAHITRENSKLEHALALLVRCLDINPDTWEGDFHGDLRLFDPWATPIEDSLFFLFNSLPSPAPNLDLFDPVQHKYVFESMEDLMAPIGTFAGLKTDLYNYQRRSAALMLQREAMPERMLDPRLEARQGPDGSMYYYNAREGTFYKSATWYDTCSGGILAESMGLGKTLICLALINATRGHPAKIPVQYQHQDGVQPLQSLRELSIKTAQRHSFPWQVEQHRLQNAGQALPPHLTEELRARLGSYEIPQPPTRWNRNTTMPPPRRLIITTTTIVVVPRNLTSQWQSEIAKHVLAGTMKVLIMDDLKQPLPAAQDLRTYDLVLFSRNRFELEAKDGSDDSGRRMAAAHIPTVCRCPYIGDTRDRNCTCLKEGDLYESPLKQLHFKRIIIDEGHSFSAKNTRAVLVAGQLVIADHRWVVSGTPAKDLMGVELDILDAAAEDTPARREALLQQRRLYGGADDHNGAARSLGLLAANFLQVAPWHASSQEPAASWDDYIYRHEDTRKRTYTAFATGLERTLRALVIKTRPEDVEDDINLPPLHHDIVHLEPSYFDKLTANLFAMTLMTNIITSERSDQDYIFHPRNLKSRQELIRNLQQSTFYWTGFSQADIISTLKNAEKYLTAPDISSRCSLTDQQDLTEICTFVYKAILTDAGWQALAKTHEVGFFIKDWPEESLEHWNFVPAQEPLLCGLTQLAEAQKHVDARLGEVDPLEGLSGLGIRTIGAAMNPPQQDATQQNTANAVLMSGEPQLLRRTRRGSGSVNVEISDTAVIDDTYSKTTAVIGSTSAKMSYLVSRIVQLHKDEKVLVFYDGENIAYYLAQALELLKINHEIYAKSLPASLKSEYLARFSEQQELHVLLMDVKQAAYGLNVTAASRIFFVNPVCRPSVEAQAIKRAHRIGQTRPVFCETLILKDSIEQRLYQRSKAMTADEHQQAKSLEDDDDMRSIIESACFVPLEEHEDYVSGQFAPFEEPQQFWGRRGSGPVIEQTIAAPKRKRASKATTGASVKQSKRQAPARKPAPKRKKVALAARPPSASPPHLSSPLMDDEPSIDAESSLLDDTSDPV